VTTANGQGRLYRSIKSKEPPVIDGPELNQVASSFDGWVETKLVAYGHTRIVYAACLQADGSPPISPPCEYVGDDEHVRFSEEY
jgi:hypothetical protein